jgi:hypothetical protein
VSEALVLAAERLRERTDDIVAAAIDEMGGARTEQGPEGLANVLEPRSIGLPPSLAAS